MSKTRKQRGMKPSRKPPPFPFNDPAVMQAFADWMRETWERQIHLVKKGKR